MPLIEAVAVDKSYVVGTTRLPVLRDLSLSVDKGEMVAIVPLHSDEEIQVPFWQTGRPVGDGVIVSE